MQIVPIRDLKNTVEIERRCKESGEPVFITKNGYGRLVVMDIELYEKTIKKMIEAELINDSLTDIKNGCELHDGEKIRRDVLKKYGK